jgi:error-prone DNA polymerase
VASTAYAELAVTSNFTFLTGGSHPEEYVEAAADLGLAGLGLADRNTLSGIVRAHTAAKERGLRFAVGCRLGFADGTPDVLAYPADRAAYGRLCRMLTAANLKGEKGSPDLRLADLLAVLSEEAGDGEAGGADGSAPGRGLHLVALPPPRPGPAFAALLAALAAAAPGRVWVGLSMNRRGDDARRASRLAALAVAHRLPLLAVGDVLYHTPARRPVQDVVACIREGATLAAAGRRLEANAERHLKAPAETARLFRAYPEAVAETVRFLGRLAFSLDELRYEYPDELRAGFATPQAALEARTAEGARERYPRGVPEKVATVLAHELAVIAELSYAPYFLTVDDIVRFARGRGILCQGRGSAANSAVCFCLGITEVDPARSDLLFERFISANRNEPPDIDVDFEHERREEVLAYVYERYGRERAGLAATTITYRTRSAVREVGKVFGLSEDTVSALAGSVWGWSSSGVAEDDVRRIGLDPGDRRLAMVMALTKALIGFPRHLSQHVGGMIVSRGRLDELVPLTRSGMESRPIIEWNKDDLEELGLLKIDILALGMLTALRKCFALLRERYGLPVTRISDVPPEDPAVYRMLQRADSVGVFQVESRAQQSMLPRLKPERFEDLVVEVAIVRPGPIQGGMVHPYLKRREGREKVEYPLPELEPVLKSTLGVPLFQEQAMQIAMVAANFSAADADGLRRAMATFRHVGTIHTFQEKLFAGMRAKGYPGAFIGDLWKQIEGFGSYGFPRSHAESFALLVYASAWVKCRYPDAFAAGLMNAWPMGFYAPAQIVRDAEEHGVEIRPVDILRSDWDHTLEAGAPAAGRLHRRHADMAGDVRAVHAVRLGLRQVEGLGEAQGRALVAARGAGFDSVRDLWLRTGLAPSVLERLADADAFRSLGLDRRAALWAVRGLGRAGDKDDLPLFRAVKMEARESEVALPAMPLGTHVVEDYRHLKLSLKRHPVAFVRRTLDARGVTANTRLPETAPGRRLTIAGLVLVRQRPGTASGVVFMTIEDETAWANVIVWPRVFERFRAEALGARLVAVTGKLQNERGVVHLVADRLQDLNGLLDGIAGAGVDAVMQSDEVKRPQDERRGPPRRPYPDEAAAVMPKGRNFH